MDVEKTMEFILEQTAQIHAIQMKAELVTADRCHLDGGIAGGFFESDVGLGRVYGSEVANLQWQFRSNGLRIKEIGSVKIDGTYDSRGRRKQREQDWSEPHK